MSKSANFSDFRTFGENTALARVLDTLLVRNHLLGPEMHPFCGQFWHFSPKDPSMEGDLDHFCQKMTKKMTEKVIK